MRSRPPFRHHLLSWLAAVCLGSPLVAENPGQAAEVSGAIVHYQLSTTGPLPRTYLVTLAITDPRDSAWVISNFASGVVRTVTAQNQGRFAESWNGLDENDMPVPPGRYGVKGIYSPAEKWIIDGHYHAVIPKLVATGCSWAQTPAQDGLPNKIEGDPVASPLRDVAIAPNGKGVLAFEYLENGKNYFLTDFTKPINYDQIITGYDSGVFAGATSACTDGQASWAFSTDGGVGFIARTDGKPFGHQKTGRDNVYLPDGWVTALAAWPNQATGRTVVFDAEGGKTLDRNNPHDESETQRVDRIRALDSDGATVLAEWKISRPLGLAVRGDHLYILHRGPDGYEVLSLPLAAGWEKETPTRVFKIPEPLHPFDIEVDSHGRIYLSDSAANHVFQFDAQGHQLRVYGRSDAQAPGRYDPQSFMAPEKLACWSDGQGKDRLLVVEMAGPNRLSEWSGDTGQLLRQWVTPQTFSNGGVAIDSRHPDHLYMQGQRDTLVRWKIDFATGQWSPEAVWTHVGGSGFDTMLVHELGLPRLIYRGDDAYLVFDQGYAVYHLEGERLRACAAILVDRRDPDHQQTCLWRDLNGDGVVQPEEYRPFPAHLPPGVLRNFGEFWTDDLSLDCIGQYTADLWRLTPTGFDRRGTPNYAGDGWKKILSDNIFLARKAGRATVLRGANEAADSFNSDWASMVEKSGGDIYVGARSGFDFSANQGAQYKLSRYVRDGRGGYTQRWRVGRVALQGAAQPGQVYSPIYLGNPINGLIPVIDNSRAGTVLYTEDGLYLDTIFPDDHLMPTEKMGAYWQPGEFFAGSTFANRDNGKIYFAMGKAMPKLYEAQGWSLRDNPVHSLTTLDHSVTLTAGEIAAPSEVALRVRGGAGSAHIARFYPSPGAPPALDGSMHGWEACDPVQFGNGLSQSVEVRCLYDPRHLYLRWHVRVGHALDLPPAIPPERIFAHESAADTLSLYLQGDPNATPGGALVNGRPGDVRFVFGLFQDHGQKKPVVVGMYPSGTSAGANARTYRTPQGGSITFARVGLVRGAQAGGSLDADGEGFVLSAALPRDAIPGAPPLDGWRTEGNFDANLGGHDRFWWSNADGSASRETFDEPTEARLYPGSWSPMECLPMTTLPVRSWMAIGPFGSPEIDRLDYDKDRDAIVKILFGATFPPDAGRDLSATYDGPPAHTRVAQRKLAWREVDLGGDSVDFQKTLGWDGGNDEGTAYLLTHIFSPTATDVSLQLTRPGGQYQIRGQLNGLLLPIVAGTAEVPATLDGSKPLHLRAGWNELLLRRDFIWGDMNLGASLKADPSVLWRLRISGPAP